MALRLKTNCSSTNICQNREQELCQHWSVSWWRGSCLRLSRATYYQTWRHLSGANTTMTLYQAYCEGDPDQSSFTASTDSHKAISTRVEIWAKEGKKECSHYRNRWDEVCGGLWQEFTGTDAILFLQRLDQVAHSMPTLLHIVSTKASIVLGRITTNVTPIMSSIANKCPMVQWESQIVLMFLGHSQLSDKCPSHPTVPPWEK